MGTLQKKCAIGSAGVHLLLVVILFVGPAFLAKKDPVVDMPILDFVPFETVDALISGGGNPNARPPAAQPNVRPDASAPIVETAPPKPEPEPEPKPVQKPQIKAPPEPEREREPEPEKPQAAMDPKPNVRKKPQVSLKPVIRKTGSSVDKAAEKAREREAREYADARRNLSQALRSAATGIPGSIADPTAVKDYRGPGGGGVPYANFLQAVKTVYTRAWVLPDGVADDDATVGASVTIARDGSVIDARLVRSSGNGAVDQSVRSTLSAVKYAAPLPRDAKEDKRTVTIDFNVKAKKLSG